eukprot:359344-Chlamydomonas_euryale.AAC.2
MTRVPLQEAPKPTTAATHITRITHVTRVTRVTRVTHVTHIARHASSGALTSRPEPALTSRPEPSKYGTAHKPNISKAACQRSSHTGDNSSSGSPVT